MKANVQILIAVAFSIAACAVAGPYNDIAVNGYVGNDGRHADPLADPNAVLNPIFRGWATGVSSYRPSPQAIDAVWTDPYKATGPATGDHFDIVSLGDLTSTMIADGNEPGEITLVFGDPNLPYDPAHIRNGSGYDFVVFENGGISDFTTDKGSVAGQIFSELGFVEVSSDGISFVRFPAASLTEQPQGLYWGLTIDITDVYQFAGKHPNAYGVCTGTPFDLEVLCDHPMVLSGLVDINDIAYIRIVDVPGSGDWLDQAGEFVDPNTYPAYSNYGSDHAIYDAWLTSGSGGFDLEAVGVLRDQEYSADINLDGLVDYADFLAFASSWGLHFGQPGFVQRCDLDGSQDLHVGAGDLIEFGSQWLSMEAWRSQN